jgi:hypothetical protein
MAFHFVSPVGLYFSERVATGSGVGKAWQTRPTVTWRPLAASLRPVSDREENWFARLTTQYTSVRVSQRNAAIQCHFPERRFACTSCRKTCVKFGKGIQKSKIAMQAKKIPLVQETPNEPAGPRPAIDAANARATPQ